jgi:hypothetical protein
LLLKEGRVRIFLVEDKSGKGPIFQTRGYGDNGQIHEPYRLELWYNGTRSIELANCNRFRGLIYAPHTTINLGPGNVEFIGSAIAKNICADGHVELYYDNGLASWKPPTIEK